MKACVFCGEVTANRVFANEQLEVLQCPGCGLVYQADYAAALAKMNAKYHSIEEYYEHRRDEHLRNDSAKDITFDSERLRRSIDIHNYLLEMVPPGGSVLDVGSGVGEFLYSLGQNGLQVAGVEPDEHIASYSRDRLGLPVITGMYHEHLYQPESFDAITFIQVLEHVENPIATLRIAHKHLRPDGLIVVDVPSYNNPRILTYRLTRQSRLVQTDFIPPHNYYYTRGSITRIAVRAGFQPLRVLTGRYSIKYSGKNKLLRNVLLPTVDRVASRFGIGGITLYARKA